MNNKDIKKYAKISRKMEKRFGQSSKKKRLSFQSPGAIESFETQTNGIRIQTERATLGLTFVTNKILQVRVRPDRQFPKVFSYAIDPEFQPTAPSVTVTEDSANISIDSQAVACQLSRSDCQLKIILSTDQEVSVDTEMGLAWSDNGITNTVQWSRQLPTDEYCYGLGQRSGGFNLRGKQLALWNFDPVGYHRDDDPVYYSIPFYLGVHPKYSIGILWDNPSRGMVDLGATQSNSMQFSSEKGELRFYLIVDDTPENVLKHYFELTGKPPLPPLWAFGYHQSRWGYKHADKFRYLADAFRHRQIPCDVLHFDIDYMDEYRVFTWNKENFPDFPQVIQEINALGFKAVAIVDPAIKADPKSEAFQSGNQAGIFHTYPDGTPFIAPVWAGDSAFPDFTMPAARQWWADHIESLVKSVGFAGLWNDMNEPTVFMPKGEAGTLPEYITANWDGHHSTHLDGAHNVYGMQMARATREGFQQVTPDKRPFVLTRAAYAGAQRYTTSWTGDNVSTWDHLKLSLSVTLNCGLSGMVFTGPDIGGFFETPEPELYARWIEAACLLPFCRTHTAEGTPDQEPWSFGTDVENIARKHINLRYQLLPYIYSSYAQCTTEGKPLVRPTFLLDSSDQKLYTQDDVYMLGDSLLIAPVLEKGATSREIYLPHGAWYDFWTGKLIDGSRTITVNAPLDHLPIFVKAGKVIPMWETMQYVGEKPLEELRLKAYAGTSETSFYEDVGEGLAYQKGDYRWSYFTCKYLPNGQFAIDWRITGNFEPSYRKSRIEIIGISREPELVEVDGQQAALWFFEGGIVEILSDPFKNIRLQGKSDHIGSEDHTVAKRPTL